MVVNQNKVQINNYIIIIYNYKIVHYYHKIEIVLIVIRLNPKNLVVLLNFDDSN
jgi:hypothetical protein